MSELLALLRNSPNDAAAQQKQIVLYFFDQFKVKDENFHSIDTNVYVLNTKTGMYTFKIIFLEDDDTVLVKVSLFVFSVES